MTKSAHSYIVGVNVVVVLLGLAMPPAGLLVDLALGAARFSEYPITSKLEISS